MPSLLELQERFAGWLAQPARELPPGLAIYRNTVVANYRNALGATYRVVQQLLGTPSFHAAVDAYVDALPPVGGDLNVYGGAFGAFLATHPPATSLLYLADVARLEWALDECQRAAEQAACPGRIIEALSTMPQDDWVDVRLRVAPYCRLLHSLHPVMRIWRVHQPGYQGGDAGGPAPGGEWLLVRREGERVTVERITRGEYEWLGNLRDGAAFGRAHERALVADETFDLAYALRVRLADRVITGLSRKPVKALRCCGD